MPDQEQGDDQQTPDAASGATQDGERRVLTGEEILNQPEEPFDAPEVGVRFRPFIRHGEAIDVFRDALDEAVGDRGFAALTLARLAVEPKVTAEQVATWSDDQTLAIIRRLLDSDDYLAPPEGAGVTLESFREAARVRAQEQQRQWDDIAKRMVDLYPTQQIARQIAELNTAGRIASLGHPDYEAISGMLSATSGVEAARKLLQQASGTQQFIDQAKAINETIRGIGAVDPKIFRPQNALADVIKRLEADNPATEAIRQAWAGNPAQDIVSDALRERERRMAAVTRDIYTPVPEPAPTRITRDGRGRGPGRPPEPATADAASRLAMPSDPGAVIEATVVTVLVDEVQGLRAEISKNTGEMSKNTTAVYDLRADQGRGAFWTKLGSMAQVVSLPVAVLALLVAWLALNQQPARGPSDSATPSAIASTSPSVGPTETAPATPRPTAGPTASSQPRSSGASRVRLGPRSRRLLHAKQSRVETDQGVGAARSGHLSATPPDLMRSVVRPESVPLSE